VAGPSARASRFKASRPRAALCLLLCAIFVSVANLCLAVNTNNNSTEWLIPSFNAAPTSLIKGTNATLWFTEFMAGRIGHIDTNGNIEEFVIPTSPSDPFGITVGPDGNFWFTEFYANKIGRLTHSNGVFKEWTIPTSNSLPSGITVGADNNLWFLEYGGDKIGVINTNGQFLIEYTNNIQVNSLLYGMVKGPDSNIWFTGSGYGRIGRITTKGVVSQFQLPATNAGPTDIIVGPDNALWFNEFVTNKIGRITTDVFDVPTNTAFQEIVLPNSGVSTITNSPYGLALGADGNIWFADRGLGSIDRLLINSSGTNVTQFFPPSTNSGPSRLTTGPDGNMWFAEAGANNIGRLFLNGLLTSSAPDIVLTNGLTFNGVIATFTDSFPPDQPHTAFSATIEWGDGTTVTTAANPASVSIVHIATNSYVLNASHTYAGTGPFTATIIIADSNGDTAIDSVPVIFAPVLAIHSATNGQSVISWPAGFTGFSLQVNSNLTSTNWVTLSNVVGARYTNNPAAPTTFYRLKK
jgi:streptogramin lyase